MKIRTVITFLALLSIVLLLAACSGAPTAAPSEQPTQAPAQEQPTEAPTKAPPTPAPTEKPVEQPTTAPESEQPETITLSLAHPVWFNDHDWTVTKIKEWEAKNPGVTVKLVELPSPDGPYREKLVLDLASGQGPDIYLADTFWFGEFAEAGYLANLTDYVNAWDDWSQWYDAAKSAVTYKDNVYGLNRTTDVRPLYYRKDLFEKAGIATPWQPTSWDDMFSAAQKLKDIGVKAPWMVKAGKVVGEATTMQGFYMLYLGCGGQLWNPETGKWDIGSQCLRDTFQVYYDLYIAKKLGGDPDNWLAGDPISNYRQMMQAGELGMIATWNGDWSGTFGPNGDFPLENRDEQLAYTKFPAQAPGKGIRGQDYVTISGGWAFVVNGASQHVDKAFDLLAYLHTKDNVISYYRDQPTLPGGLPTRQDVTNSEEWQSLVDDYMLWQAEELVPLTTFRPPVPEYPKVSEAIQSATETILLGGSVDDALAQYQDDVIRIVGEDNVTK